MKERWGGMAGTVAGEYDNYWFDLLEGCVAHENIVILFFHSSMYYSNPNLSMWLHTAISLMVTTTWTMDLFPEELICQILELVEPLDIVHCTEVSLQP
jgi:hypothetical protein